MQEFVENLYSIQFVSNITGINPHTIRAWEKRYGATTPQRDKNGRRLYSDNEIQRLDVLNKLVSFGNNISDIANLTKEKLDSVLEKYDLNTNKNDVKESQVITDVDSILKNIFLSIKFFKLDVLAHELQKAEESLNSMDFALKVVNPLIQEIRKLKGASGISVEECEQAFLVIKSHLSKKMHRAQNTSRSTRRVLVSSPKGQLNELGTMVAAIVFLNNRFEVEFLGGDVRASILAKLSTQFETDYIFVGLNYSHDLTMSLAEKEKYLEGLRKGIDSKSEILIGAYDYCFKLTNENMECFNDFKALENYISKS